MPARSARTSAPPAGLPLLAQSPVPGTQPEADLTLDGRILRSSQCAPRNRALLAHPCVLPDGGRTALRPLFLPGGRGHRPFFAATASQDEKMGRIRMSTA